MLRLYGTLRISLVRRTVHHSLFTVHGISMILAEAKKVIRIEAEALMALADSINGEFQGAGGGDRHGEIGADRPEDRLYHGINRHSRVFSPSRRGNPRRPGDDHER